MHVIQIDLFFKNKSLDSRKIIFPAEFRSFLFRHHAGFRRAPWPVTQDTPPDSRRILILRLHCLSRRQIDDEHG